MYFKLILSGSRIQKVYCLRPLHNLFSLLERKDNRENICSTYYCMYIACIFSKIIFLLLIGQLQKHAVIPFISIDVLSLVLVELLLYGDARPLKTYLHIFVVVTEGDDSAKQCTKILNVSIIK